MSITLERFVIGMVDYIAKHNANATTIETEINSIRTALSGQSSTSVSFPNALNAMFGSEVAIIGAGGCPISVDETANTVTIGAGTLWIPEQQAVVNVTETVVSFASEPAGTYYLSAMTSGNVIASTGTLPGRIYSISWNTSTFGSPVLLAKKSWSTSEWIGAQTSAALGSSYSTLDARLEAGEVQAVIGGTYGTAVSTKLSKSVAGGVNVTLTAAECQAALFEFTGVLTADIAVILNSSKLPRQFAVRNSTTGGFALTIKLTTGVVLLPGYTATLVWDGTAVEFADTNSFITATQVPYAASVTLDWSKYDVAYITLSGDIAITHTNARPGQKCLLCLEQDATGGRVASWGSEVAFGADIGGVTLSTAGGKVDEIGFSYNWVKGKYNVVSVAKGY